MREQDDFREFVEARSSALLRTAWMFTGDAHLAEDLLQTALARTWPHWERIRYGSPEAYVRTVMVRTHASWRARLWRRESPTADLAGLRSVDVAANSSDRIKERCGGLAVPRISPASPRQAPDGAVSFCWTSVSLQVAVIRAPVGHDHDTPRLKPMCIAKAARWVTLPMSTLRDTEGWATQCRPAPATTTRHSLCCCSCWSPSP